MPGTPGTSGISHGAPDPGAEGLGLRDHVKLRRSLAVQMRDAVWYLTEHGRPRVQLGEILDEAIGEWLDRQKAEHTGGADFPHRGRLR